MHACLVVSLLLMPASAPPGAETDRDPVAFSLRDSSDVVVAVTVGRRGPFRFLLDTGSTRSAVASRIASDLDLPVTGRTTVVTPAGHKTRLLVRAAITVGQAHADVDVMVLAAEDLHGIVDGIIGTDLLASRRFTIDYVRRRLSFDGPEDTGGASVPLTHGASGFVVTLPQDEAAPPLQFIPDSGTATVVLIARHGRRLPRVTPLAPLPLHAIGGVRVGRSVVLDELRIGSISLRDQPAVVMRGSSADARLGDGLLPLHLFARVTFDAHAGLLTVVGRN